MLPGLRFIAPLESAVAEGGLLVVEAVSVGVTATEEVSVETIVPTLVAVEPCEMIVVVTRITVFVIVVV
jgi:hypothetical protein